MAYSEQPQPSSGGWGALALLLLLLSGGGYYFYSHRQPPPPPPRLAPDGEYFLTQYVASPTQNGVIGFAAGSHVKLRAKHGHQWTVSDGQYETTVHESLLTNDLDVAERVRSGEVVSQASTSAAQSAMQANYERTETKRRMEFQQQTDAAKAKSAGVPVGVTPRLLDQPAVQTGSYYGPYSSNYPNYRSAITTSRPAVYNPVTGQWIAQ